MLTPEQTEIVKKQLIQHIEKSFPEDKRAFATEQIMTMGSEELEEFLKKNKLMPSGDSSKTSGCIFCSIIKGEINSYKIDENNNAVAVLEINPLSKGHVLIIPKEHISSSEEVPASVFSFAKKIAKKIKTKLGPKSTEISSSNILGHEIINIIPLYGEEKPEKRYSAKPEDLLELQKMFIKAKKKQVIKKVKLEKTSEKIRLPKRIP